MGKKELFVEKRGVRQITSINKNVKSLRLNKKLNSCEPSNTAQTLSNRPTTPINTSYNQAIHQEASLFVNKITPAKMNNKLPTDKEKATEITQESIHKNSRLNHSSANLKIQNQKLYLSPTSSDTSIIQEYDWIGQILKEWKLLTPGKISLIFGPKGIGKTQLLLSIAEYLAHTHCVIFICGEYLKEKIKYHLIPKYTRLALKDIKYPDFLNKKEKDYIQSIQEKLSKLKLYHFDFELKTADDIWIQAILHQCKNKKKIPNIQPVIIIDGLLRFLPYHTDLVRSKFVIDAFKDIAKRLKAPIILSNRSYDDYIEDYEELAFTGICPTFFDEVIQLFEHKRQRTETEKVIKVYNQAKLDMFLLKYHQTFMYFEPFISQPLTNYPP
ncbi:DnaB-like helicase C-terminal domain-containing protein [Basilea psittacipulmonis]|uniref:SF4 helicase domain-containing protein n=1 Tax=Basilea psittacipulmonis DSM 24701 TaxID=1072685 RepID=A0A077DDA5_9BURK|nr:DnaB-like helicase C-terminal domain-containing protein [Basilea psittacipulmonis]AIL32589.1 hypothetical protein IX83_04050 [Basilea psittacipulmonis DSM 24701]